MDTPPFADRVSNLAPSSIRRMMAIAKQKIAEGKTVYELNIGQPDIACIPAFSEAICRKVKEEHLIYSPYIGEKYLRETFARYLNHHFDRRGVQHMVVDTENILVTVGASHALTITFLALCNPGDQILCIEPFFPPYFGFLSVSGGTLKAVPTYAEQDFVLPPDEEIEKLITPKTRAILFNSPCNPSGKIFSPEEITRLARIAVKHNIFLIGDEVYREMILGETESFSLLQVQLPEPDMEKLKNLIIIVDSASKSFSLCGSRIGFIVSRAPIIEKIAMVTAHTVASVSDLLQFGVAAAYDQVMRDPGYFQLLRKTYRDRLESTMAAVKKYLPGVVAPKPNGGFYLMIQFPELKDVTEYSHFLIEKFNIGSETVAVTPAGSFYQTANRGKNEVRLALVVDPDKMARSIFIMAEAYKAYKSYLGNQQRPCL